MASEPRPTEQRLPRGPSALDPEDRARVIAGQVDVSPSEINRATLSWYQLHQLQRKALFDPGLTASRPTLFV